MSAYVIFIREQTNDSDELKIYSEKAPAGLVNHPVNPLALYGKYEVLEGPEAEGAAILEFPTFEQAKAWYFSPAYQDAVKHRLKGGTYRGIIVEGISHKEGEPSMSDQHSLPEMISRFIEASNNHDTEAALACLADDVLLFDDAREFGGKLAFQKWSDAEYIGSHVNLKVLGAASLQGSEYLVSTEINGDYPACPYYFDYTFTLKDGLIAKVEISESKTGGQ